MEKIHELGTSPPPQKKQVIMERNTEKLDELRRNRSELENHVIDEFVSGNLSRREFLRRGSIIGISIPLLGAIVTACGSANSSSSATSTGGSTPTAKPQAGATLRIAGVVPDQRHQSRPDL